MSPIADRRRHRRGALLPLVLVVGLLAAACGSNGPSATPASTATASPGAGASSAPSPTPAPSGAAPSASAAGDVDAIYDQIEQQVAEIRGLRPKRAVPRQFITTAELKALLTEQFDKDAPPAYVAANERLYKALGLIPADADLRTLTLDLVGGGVVGFYRDDEGKLYVVSKSGAPGANEKFYFSHEYDHALQDQNFTVFKDQDGILDQSDRILARQAVYEGDATLLMTLWAAANLSQAELLEVVSGSMDPEVTELLDRTPAILRAPLEFPYTTGFAFINGINATGGWQAIDGLYARMPESTEQILHPAKYQAGEVPVKVTLPPDLAKRLGTGWTVAAEDTFGELQIGIWLREGGVDPTTADAAAAGWGGDRLAVLDGPADAWAVVIDTAWDTDADATAFATAATTALGKAGGEARVLPGVGGKSRWVVVASDPSVFKTVSNALGLAG
jgi:hypothetical protein